VVAELSVKLTITQQFAFALQVCKATLLLLVLRLGVAPTMNVPQIKSVTLPLVVALLEKNVDHFVVQATVLMELIALPKTTGRPAPADIP
jgi:hypothetical protein